MDDHSLVCELMGDAEREVITHMHRLEFDTQRKGLIVQSPTTPTDVPYFSIFLSPSVHHHPTPHRRRKKNKGKRGIDKK